jgi:hypothetical protein
VTNAFRDREIPYYRQEQLASGLRLAFPAWPAPGPGVWWAVYVPEQTAEEARKLLSELPIAVTTEPDIWHFGPSERVKKGWRLAIWIILLTELMFVLSSLITSL